MTDLSAIRARLKVWPPLSHVQTACIVEELLLIAEQQAAEIERLRTDIGTLLDPTRRHVAQDGDAAQWAAYDRLMADIYPEEPPK